MAAATARSVVEESDDNDAASMASANSPGIEGVTTQPRLFSMIVNAASASSSETRMTGRQERSFPIPKFPFEGKFDVFLVADDEELSLPNVDVYDFHDAQNITHDLSNYLDLIHHSPLVDLQILSKLAAEDHAVSRDAPTASIKRLQSQVDAYQFRS